MNPAIIRFLRPHSPDFADLPWQLPIEQWKGVCNRLEEVQRGLSRHPVVFVNYSGSLYGIKELPPGLAEQEYELLAQIEAARLPAVTPIGHIQVQRDQNVKTSVLITRYLDRSLPYRSLFLGPTLTRYREGLLDAIAGLLVQLHLAGFYWGDCSLSNTLFRRDDGALRAYLVDAETARFFPDQFPAQQRFYDLEIMEENVNGDLALLAINEQVFKDFPISDTGSYIRLRYQRLWEEITHEDIINPNEHYRIQDRINALNALGFSVSEVELAESDNGAQLRLRVIVSDRNFHLNQLLGLTGVVAEENQARKMMNEIQEVKATLTAEHNRSTPLSAAAYHWLETLYHPTLENLKPLMDENTDLSELYCQVLEHKWYLSERAKQDVGHKSASDDYLQVFSKQA